MPDRGRLDGGSDARISAPSQPEDFTPDVTMHPAAGGPGGLDAVLTWLLDGCEAVDLSHAFEEGMPRYSTHSPYQHQLWESYWDGDAAVAYHLSMNEHTGTHVDAPAHFVRDGHDAHTWVDELSVTSLIGRGVCIDATDATAGRAFGTSVVERFERRHGEIRAGDVVMFHTGWSDRWAVAPQDRGYGHPWPGPDDETAHLLRDRRVRAVGTDTMGIDGTEAAGFPVHNILLGARILVLENLARLGDLPPVSLFVAFPLRIAGGSGSPLRPVAFVPKATSSAITDSIGAAGDRPEAGGAP